MQRTVVGYPDPLSAQIDLIGAPRPMIGKG